MASNAPSPGTPAPFRLLDLPRELLVRAVSCCTPTDISRAAGVSKLFHDPAPPLPRSLAEEGIRLWVQERAFELLAQPEGERCAMRWLLGAAV